MAQTALTRVGPYRVVAPLASGEIERALACEEGAGPLHPVVLLSVARSGASSFAEHAQQLAREAAAGARLDHPHVLRTLRFFADSAGQVLVHEYLGGATLRELLDARAVPFERWSDDMVLLVGAGACRALACAEARGADALAPIGHGRFDADAVHLGPDGAVKVSGFAEGSATSGADRAAVGRMLWELLAGFPQSSRDESLTKYRHDLPPEVTAVIDAACAAEPSAVSAEQLAAWLDKATCASRARTEIARRVAAQTASRRSALAAAPSSPVRTLDRFGSESLRKGAALVAIAGASFALGRASHPVEVKPKQAIFAAEADSRRAASPASGAVAVPAVGAADVATAVAESTSPRAPVALPLHPEDGASPDAAPTTGAREERAAGFEGGSGMLTVHSPARSGSVYVQVLRVGAVDEPMTVPCGRRVVGLGVPSTKHVEPKWLAPSQVVRVPCGGAAETTIVPRSRKRRGRP